MAAAGVVREQVARALMERIIVHRPHPWGVLATLSELVRRPDLGLFQCAFVRSSPDVEKLFESVARSCNGGQLPAHAAPPARSNSVSSTASTTSDSTQDPGEAR